jgi:ribosomal protein L14E/L6E/L27E
MTNDILQVGRVCIKKFGRDAGSRAVITKVIDGSFVNVITAIRPKERRCNVSHLEFLDEVIDTGKKDVVNKTLGIEQK